VKKTVGHPYWQGKGEEKARMTLPAPQTEGGQVKARTRRGNKGKKLCFTWRLIARERKGEKGRSRLVAVAEGQEETTEPPLNRRKKRRRKAPVYPKGEKRQRPIVDDAGSAPIRGKGARGAVHLWLSQSQGKDLQSTPTYKSGRERKKKKSSIAILCSGGRGLKIKRGRRAKEGGKGECPIMPYVTEGREKADIQHLDQFRGRKKKRRKERMVPGARKVNQKDGEEKKEK